MRIPYTLVPGIIASLLATAAQAQEASPPFTLATYYHCDYVRQTRADTLYRQVMAPILDRQITAGQLTSYAFSSHRIGGEFRRLESWTAPNLEQLMAAQDAYFEELAATNPKASAEFDSICGEHQDYIWVRVLASAPNPAAPAPAFQYSRYFSCSEEATADMIMETAFADILNKHVAEGHIEAWGWLTHAMGGTIRRILNWRGPDVMSVLNAEELLVSDLVGHPMWAAFNQACGSHTDYLWQTEVSGR